MHIIEIVQFMIYIYQINLFGLNLGQYTNEQIGTIALKKSFF